MTTLPNYSKKKAAMVESGKALSEIIRTLRDYIEVGVTTLAVNDKATQLIKSYGFETSFDKVPGYNWATCMSVNEIIVHGIPNQYKLQKNDLLKLDIGIYNQGYHIDYGDVFYMGTPSKSVQRFLDAGEDTLAKVIELAKYGQHIGRISQVIEQSIEKAGYRVIYDLTGHAVGKELHEDPFIPQFLDGKISQTPKFEEGNAYALEIIYSESDSEVRHANSDDWSLRTKNKSLGCCFENTIFIEKGKTTVIVN